MKTGSTSGKYIPPKEVSPKEIHKAHREGKNISNKHCPICYPIHSKRPRYSAANPRGFRYYHLRDVTEKVEEAKLNTLSSGFGHKDIIPETNEADGSGGPGYAYSILQCKTDEQTESVVQAIQITERKRVVEMIEGMKKKPNLLDMVVTAFSAEARNRRDIKYYNQALSDLQSKLREEK